MKNLYLLIGLFFLISCGEEKVNVIRKVSIFVDCYKHYKGQLTYTDPDGDTVVLDSLSDDHYVSFLVDPPYQLYIKTNPHGHYRNGLGSIVYPGIGFHLYIDSVRVLGRHDFIGGHPHDAINAQSEFDTLLAY